MSKKQNEFSSKYIKFFISHPINNFALFLFQKNNVVLPQYKSEYDTIHKQEKCWHLFTEILEQAKEKNLF